MQDVKAPAGEWRIGNFFIANDKLESAVHGDCPALKRFAASEAFWRIAEHEAATARLVLADARRSSGQMQPALSGTGQ
ncbi:hypothetical protein [Mesorhizobium metallidurans]|uniref:hypothetical protein n=1 Tax=Mesorhizobium metallidurans TaxID=489722 RepID=UPI0012FBDF82|nr:hypothetical protein [Mesorhizobium metallidurans]